MLTFFDHLCQRGSNGYSNRDMTMAKLKIVCFGPNYLRMANKYEGAAVVALGFDAVLEHAKIRLAFYDEIMNEIMKESKQ